MQSRTGQVDDGSIVYGVYAGASRGATGSSRWIACSSGWQRPSPGCSRCPRGWLLHPSRIRARARLPRGPLRPGNTFGTHGPYAWNGPSRLKVIDIDRATPCRERTTITAQAGIMRTGEILTVPLDRYGATPRYRPLGRPQYGSDFRLLGGPLDPLGLIDAPGQTAMVLGASARLTSQPGPSQHISKKPDDCRGSQPSASFPARTERTTAGAAHALLY